MITVYDKNDKRLASFSEVNKGRNVGRDMVSFIIMNTPLAKTFADASNECENVYGGELVSIHNIYQNAYIRSIAVNCSILTYNRCKSLSR